MDAQGLEADGKGTSVEYHCPICNYFGKFNTCNKRLSARCPSCSSLERHRAQYLEFTKTVLPILPKKPTILHTAPEEGVRGYLEQIAGKYIPSDIRESKKTQYQDLTRLTLKSNAIDFVWSSHVLEHIKNVDQAIAEIFRVMTHGAYALLDVPACIRGITTRNDQPDEHDHWWLPGNDWFLKYQNAGFEIIAIKRPEDFPTNIRPPDDLALAVVKKP